MANEKPVTHDEVIGLVGYLLKRVRDALVDAQALKALLIQSGAFSEETFEKMRAFADQEWERQDRIALEGSLVAAQNEAVEKLLREFRGRPQ